LHRSIVFVALKHPADRVWLSVSGFGVSYGDFQILRSPNAQGNTIILKAIITLLCKKFSFLQSQSIDLCASIKPYFKQATPCTAQTLHTGEGHFNLLTNFGGTNVIFESLRSKRKFKNQPQKYQEAIIQLLDSRAVSKRILVGDRNVKAAMQSLPESSVGHRNVKAAMQSLPERFELCFLDSFWQDENWESLWVCIFHMALLCEQYARLSPVDYNSICAYTPDFPALKAWIIDCFEKNVIVSDVPYLNRTRKIVHIGVEIVEHGSNMNTELQGLF